MLRIELVSDQPTQFNLPTGSRPQRIVVKLGTGILTQGIGQLHNERIQSLSQQFATLRQAGHDVLVVSSGAVGLGMGRLGYDRRPKSLDRLQSCAAVGQSILTETWQAALKPHDIVVAQILLTREDVRTRTRHIAVKDLFTRLLESGIIPIINENDCLSTDEIRFGDNDILSAMVGSLVGADMLCILSTAPGLVDRDGSGEIVPVVPKITPMIEAMAGGTESTTAVGGMRTKIDAARLATRSGCATFIGSGAQDNILLDAVRAEATGTYFVPSKLDLSARQRWLAFFQKPAGTIYVDSGARKALSDDGRSLLAKGIVRCEGTFEKGDTVNVVELNAGRPFARGLIAYPQNEMEKLCGLNSDDIQKRYPRRKRLEVIHRDTLVLLD